MPSTNSTYKAKLPSVEVVEVGLDNTLTCPIWLADALVVPTSARVSIYDAGNTAVVDDVAAAVTNSVATFEALAVDTADWDLGEGWRVIWTLTIDGTDYRFRNGLEVVRHRLYNPVTNDDLYIYASGLDPDGTSPITREANFDDQLAEAWRVVESEIRKAGRRPDLIFIPGDVRRWVIHMALAIIFGDFANRAGAERYADRAREQRELANAERESVRLTYAERDTEVADEVERSPRRPGFFLGGVP
jgi:hypothetical protein